MRPHNAVPPPPSFQCSRTKETDAESAFAKAIDVIIIIMAVNAADVFIGVGRCFLHHLSRKRTATANTNMRIVTPSPPLMLFAKTIGPRARWLGLMEEERE